VKQRLIIEKDLDDGNIISKDLDMLKNGYKLTKNSSGLLLSKKKSDQNIYGSLNEDQLMRISPATHK
jgi:hypothetical protein